MVTTPRRRTAAAAAVAIAAALLTVGQSDNPYPVAVKSSESAAAPSLDVEVYRACLANKPPPELRLPEPASAFLAGYANAAKLGSAAVLGSPEPALVRSTNENEGLWAAYGAVVDGERYVCNLVEAQLDYQGRRELPPVRATFLTFGFMPVTATLHLTQVGDDPLTAVVYLDNGGERTNTLLGDGSAFAVATATMALRLSDVEVNGERLDVGEECRTVGPLTSPDSPIDPTRLVLTGGNLAGEPEPRYGAVIYGGALAGRATIPPFTGCGTGGEDLDPLLTATVSGPGNDVKIIQAPLCNLDLVFLCVDDVRNGPRYRPLWTVTDGGPFTGAGTLTIQVGGGFGLTTITCPDSAVSGVFADATGPPRRSLAAIEWSVGECSGRDRRGQTSTWTVSQDESLRIDGATYDPATGVTSAKLSGVSMRLVGTGVPGATGPCEIELRGMGSATYANPPSGALSVLANASAFGSGIFAVSTTCPGPLGPTGWVPHLSATYPLSPGTTTITSP